MLTTTASSRRTAELTPPGAGRAPAAERNAGRARAMIPALIVAVAALCAGALLATRVGYVPMWDGRIYADCIIDAATQPFRIEAYRCANHVSYAYVALVSLVQRLAPYSPLPMLLANVALFALAAVAFWRILGRLLPDPSHATARALTTAAFLVHPIVLAAVVQPGLDFGVLVFSLCVIAAAVEGRASWFAVAGTFLVLTKETGLVVYAVVITLYAWRAALPSTVRQPVARTALLGGGAFVVVYNLAPDHPAILPVATAAGLVALLIARPRGVGRPELAEAGRRLAHLWPLAVPLAAFGAHTAHRLYEAASAAAAGPQAAPQDVMWGKAGARVVFDMFVSFEMDPWAVSAFALVFVVGFLWLPSAIVGIDTVVGAARAVRRRPPRALPGADPSLVGLVLAMTAALVWLLTRYETFSNARYYLPAYPLLLVAACCALVRLGVPRRAREATIGVVALLLAVSATRTIDPLSRALWGTFKFGDRELLRVTSITGECCGHGRDQLAYNLEFTAFAAAQDALYARVRPTDFTAFVMHDYANLHTVGTLDARTGARTLRRHGVIKPGTTPVSIAAEAPVRLAEGFTAWYVAFPNMNDAGFLPALRARFELGPPVWGTAPGGYAMVAFPMRERLRVPGPVSR